MSRPDGCCAALGAVSERAWRFASVRPLLARGQAAVAVIYLRETAKFHFTLKMVSMSMNRGSNGSSSAGSKGGTDPLELILQRTSSYLKISALGMLTCKWRG